MIKHQIKFEGELFSNAFNSTSGALGKQKLPLINEGSDTSVVQSQIIHIFKSHRATLLDKFCTGWRTDMENKNEHILTYKWPDVSESLIDLAKQFYKMVES